ncbi:unnamed protein product [Nyctereutes procyonoides]|uniref:(raccoon dog) hypothetical protein n=1 Tax=Nyctereutes procyonoides TaxID=34880 RepID=A0A811YUT4_NYCPR|nr:unnamed protein product [Nyctereutes procyonoides]
MRRGRRDGLGGPPTPRHRRAGAEGGRARGARPGPRPPFLALARRGPGQRLEPDGSRPGHAHCGLPPGEVPVTYTPGEPSSLYSQPPGGRVRPRPGVPSILLSKQVYDKAQCSLMTSVRTVSWWLNVLPLILGGS